MLKLFWGKFNLNCFALTLTLALGLFAPTTGQAINETGVRFNSFELMVEIGPAFLENPVYQTKTPAGNDSIQVTYKIPRYVGLALGWWVQDYILLQGGINFITADIKNANYVSGMSEITNASGSFFSLVSFVNLYGNFPLSRTISIYGGGGVGFAWSKTYRGMIEGADIAPDDPLATNISASRFSYSLTPAAGFRVEVFEGFVADIGYQLQWNPNLYIAAEGGKKKLIHQLRLGFVFEL